MITIEMLDQDWLVTYTKSWKSFTNEKAEEKLEIKMSGRYRYALMQKSSWTVVTIQIDEICGPNLCYVRRLRIT